MDRDWEHRSSAHAGPPDHFRRSARRGGEFPVEYAACPPGEEALAEERDAVMRRAATLNIGEGGTFIVTDDPLPEGSRILVRLALPRGGALLIHGEVRWLVEGGDDEEAVRGMGVRFGALDPRQRRLLHEHFAAHPAVINHDEA